MSGEDESESEKDERAEEALARARAVVDKANPPKKRDPGRWLALVPVTIAILMMALMMPRATVPDAVPLPTIDMRALSETMRADDAATTNEADRIYVDLQNAGIDTLYDDRDERGGVKLGSMDLIGLPWQLIVGPRGIASGTVELKRRSTGEREELSIESALARLTA